MKMFEMFAGFGGASFALKKAGIDFECVGVSEVDKYAMQCYTQNHKGYHYGDCTKIDPHDLPDFDLLTGGFPCQSFSVAGKGLGELDPRGTLFYEIVRIAEVKKPKYMLLENVKGLTNKTHKATFDKILSELKRIGYDVIWKVLNSKDYGIPQNRERIFFVCKLGQWEFNEFHFPSKLELGIFVKDILQDEVADKFYLSEEHHQRFVDYLNKKHGTIFAMRGRNPQNPTSRESGLPTIQMLEPREDGCSNTISTVQKDNLVFIGEHQSGQVIAKEGVSPSLTAVDWKSPLKVIVEGRIRRLTPIECFRLMGFLDDEINLEGISDTQRYKLAGNGWDINLVSKLFKQMFALGHKTETYLNNKNLKGGIENGK